MDMVWWLWLAGACERASERGLEAEVDAGSGSSRGGGVGVVLFLLSFQLRHLLAWQATDFPSLAGCRLGLPFLM